MENYELNGTHCPVCGHEETRCRPCSNFCDNGYFEASALTFSGDLTELLEPCPECRGTSIEVWCTHCGTNVSGIHVTEEQYCTKTPD